MESKTFKNIFWNTLGTIINSFSSLIYLVVVTRINGIDCSGIFSFCFSFSLVLFTVSNLGGRVFEVSDKEQFDDNYYYTLKLYTCFITTIIAVVFAFIMKYEPIKFFLIIIFMLVRSIESLSDTIYAVFQKNDHLNYVGFSYLLKNFVSFMVFTAVDLIFKNIIIASLSLLLATSVIYVVFDQNYVRKFKKLKIEYNSKNIISLFKHILPFLLFNLLTMVIANVPRIIVDLFYTDSELGYLGILMMIPTVIILLGQLTIQPFINDLTNNFCNEIYNKISTSLLRIVALITVFSLTCSLGAYLLGPWALQILYGLNFKNYRTAIAVLVITGMFNCYSMVLSTVLTIVRKTKIQLWVYSFIFIFESVIMYALLPFLSFSAVFWIYLLVMIVQFIIFLVCYYIFFVRRYINAEG